MLLVDYEEKEGEQKKSKRYYCLNFEYQFEHEDDIVYFAYSYPYTCTEILADIHQMEVLLYQTYFTQRSLAGEEESFSPLRSKRLPSKSYSLSLILGTTKSGSQTKSETELNASPTVSETIVPPDKTILLTPSVLRIKKSENEDCPTLFYERRTLCKSNMGIPVPLITISSKKNMRVRSSKRKYVVITS